MKELPSFLDQPHLQAGATVGLAVNPSPRQRYTLAELLAACDFTKPLLPEEREWLDAPAVGDELI
jgi:antitoxin ChpS